MPAAAALNSLVSTAQCKVPRVQQVSSQRKLARGADAYAPQDRGTTLGLLSRQCPQSSCNARPVLHPSHAAVHHLDCLVRKLLVIRSLPGATVSHFDISLTPPTLRFFFVAFRNYARPQVPFWSLGTSSNQKRTRVCCRATQNVLMDRSLFTCQAGGDQLRNRQDSNTTHCSEDGDSAAKIVREESAGIAKFPLGCGVHLKIRTVFRTPEQTLIRTFTSASCGRKGPFVLETGVCMLVQFPLKAGRLPLQLLTDIIRDRVHHHLTQPDGHFY